MNAPELIIALFAVFWLACTCIVWVQINTTEELQDLTRSDKAWALALSPVIIVLAVIDVLRKAFKADM